MTRVLSAAAIVAVLVSAVWLGPDWATLAIGLVASVLAATELVGLSGVPRSSLPVLVAAVAAGCTTWAFVHGDTLAAVLLAAAIVTGVAMLAAGSPSPSAIPATGFAFMAPVYVGVPIGALIW